MPSLDIFSLFERALRPLCSAESPLQCVSTQFLTERFARKLPRILFSGVAA